MNPDQRQSISSLYHAARQRPAGEREAFLRAACKDDALLRQEVESLLAFDSASTRFLERSAAMVAGGDPPDYARFVGRQFGPYMMVAPLGAGGMGRDVAIKILPPHLTADAERVARFAREARLLAALSHPHIAAIYGLEEVDGASALVLEFVDGPTLADRLERGPLPLAEAIPLARQIADALDAAHEKGIVHRDLKPANIILQRGLSASGVPSGELCAKVLDFGLAKTIASDLHDDTPQDASSHGVTHGQILGTLPYMSPEQAKGLAVDKRTDIWAFGCVLFEMLTARLAFAGDTVSDTLVAILDREPDWARLPAATPLSVRTLLERCLRKDPRQRLHDIADARIELHDVERMDDRAGRQLPHASDRTAITAESTAPVRQRRWPWRSAAALLVSLLTLGAGAAYVLRGRNPDRLPTFGNLVQVTSAIGVEDYPAWSPDGRTLAYEAGGSGPGSSGGNWDIWVAQVGGGAAINRTPDHQGEDRFPVWSPDGRQIAFWSSRDGGGCFVMPALAGAPRKIATSGLRHPSRPQWSADGTKLACVTAPDNAFRDAGVDVVSLRNGEAKTMALPGDGFRFDLAWSADGRFFAYVDGDGGLDSDVSQLKVVRAGDDKAVAVTDGRTKVRGPFWSADARWLYYVTNRDGAMDVWRQSLARDGALVGPSIRVTTGLEVREAALSADGAKLAYSRGREVANAWSVPVLSDRPATWADARQVTFDHALIEFLDLSPDGKTLAVSSDRSGNLDLWLVPTDGGEMRPITTDPTPDWAPRWSPDGKEIAFYSYRTGNRDVWVLPLDGGPARQLTRDPEADMTPRWSADGREIVFGSARSPNQFGSWRVWIVSAAGGQIKPIDNLPASLPRSLPVYSPDGQWLALYVTRGEEVRLWRTRVDGSGAERVTNGPGGDPIWSPDSKQLFFPGVQERTGNVWAIALADHRERPVTALTGRLGNLMQSALATDGRRLFFCWEENVGDIWVMDVTSSRPD
jgi:Tol biopolymer transport system component/serine/threonine protein kinase